MDYAIYNFIYFIEDVICNFELINNLRNWQAEIVIASSKYDLYNFKVTKI